MLWPRFDRLIALAGLSLCFGCGASDVLAPAEEVACAAPSDPLDIPALPTNLEKVPAVGTLGAATLFQHGVASGDPTETDVIVWTRVTTGATDPVTVSVFFEVALDKAFKNRVAAGSVTTDAGTDHTVKIDVTGLQWGRDYFYRFHALGRTSPVGHTRLAPSAEQKACARFAVVSCASYAHGYFYGYKHIADRDDVDAVIHLGDYIYEYESGGYGDVRPYEPEHELITLADYRARYAQYRRDDNLQAIHLAHPMFATWDDHEVADNAYLDGAVTHQEKDGDWEARKAAAKEAYFEWMPIRETPDRRVWRSFQYGNLAHLVFLDTRVAGRDKQISVPADDGPERHILDAEQQDWLAGELANSTSTWEIIAQQVMVGQLIANKTPFNMDQWDGYSASRNQLFDMFEAKDENVIVLTGDIHSSWALELARDPFADDYKPSRDNLAVEFVVPAISSPGFPKGSEDILGPVFDKENSHLKWSDLIHRGYMILDVTPARVGADYYFLDGVEAGQGEQSLASELFTLLGDARIYIKNLTAVQEHND